MNDSLSAKDHDNLVKWGMNVVRLGVMWYVYSMIAWTVCCASYVVCVMHGSDQARC